MLDRHVTHGVRVGGVRYFMHEHPDTASSWRLDCIKELAAHPSVHESRAHMCAYGLTSVDEHGEGLVRKATRCLTNSPEVAKMLQRQCTPILRAPFRLFLPTFSKKPKFFYIFAPKSPDFF